IGQKGRLVEELAGANERLQTESRRLLRGPTAPLAASELQQLVKDRISGASVEVRSERVLPVSDQQGLQEISIELAFMGGIRDTVTVLAGLERSPHLLALKDLKIRVVTGGHAAGLERSPHLPALKDLKIRVVTVGQPRELLTTLVVAGYLMPPPAAGAKPPGAPNGTAPGPPIGSSTGAKDED